MYYFKLCTCTTLNSIPRQALTLAVAMEPALETETIDKKLSKKIAHEIWMRREERKWFPNLTGEMDESSSEDGEGDRE